MVTKVNPINHSPVKVCQLPILGGFPPAAKFKYRIVALLARWIIDGATCYHQQFTHWSKSYTHGKYSRTQTLVLDFFHKDCHRSKTDSSKWNEIKSIKLHRMVIGQESRNILPIRIPRITFLCRRHYLTITIIFNHIFWITSSSKGQVGTTDGLFPLTS